MRNIVLMGALTAGALAVAGPPAHAQTAPASPAATVDRQKFSNTWKLNVDESEKLRDKMHQARGGEHAGGGGGRGHGYGGGGWEEAWVATAATAGPPRRRHGRRRW
jgi:hypothetical protein